MNKPARSRSMRRGRLWMVLTGTLVAAVTSLAIQLGHEFPQGRLAPIPVLQRSVTHTTNPIHQIGGQSRALTELQLLLPSPAPFGIILCRFHRGIRQDPIVWKKTPPKNTAKPWFSNRQIYVGFGTVLTSGPSVGRRGIAQFLDLRLRRVVSPPVRCSWHRAVAMSPEPSNS
jgi:hypothetical protein